MITMFRPGTKLNVLRDDGWKDILTIGYCGKQLSVIDRSYHVYCPAFYYRDDKLNEWYIKTKDHYFSVIDVRKCTTLEIRPFLASPDFMFLISGEKNGDLMVFCSPEEERYTTLKIGPQESEASINEKMKDLYYTERMLHLATYRCLESPYLESYSDLRQYGLWLERGRVHIDVVLESNLRDIKSSGYKKLIPEDDASGVSHNTDQYLFGRKDRMTWLFPLSDIEYDIDDLLNKKVIAVFPEKWKGYKKIKNDFCERGGCL